MNNSKRKASQDLQNSTEPFSKVPKNYSNFNDRQNKLYKEWVHSKASTKSDQIIESEHSSFIKSQRLLRGILTPIQQTDDPYLICNFNDDNNRDDTRSKICIQGDDSDSNNSKNSPKKFIETDNDAIKPFSNLIRDIIEHLTKEFMNYEMKISNLYDKVGEMTVENEKIRNRYTLMCGGVIKNLKSLNQSNQSGDSEEFTSDDETCASDGATTDEEGELIELREQTGKSGVFRPPKQFSPLKEKLESLECHILKKLGNFRRNRKDLSNISINDLEELGVNLEEMSLVKNLRTNMNRAADELKEVRKFAEIRIANLKSTLALEKKLTEKAQKDVEESKRYVEKATNFVQRTASRMERLKVENETQSNVIESLQRQLSLVQERLQHIMQSPPYVGRYNPVVEDHQPLLEKYNRVFTAYTVLNSISHMQKSDVTILHELYEEERAKCISLTKVVEQQRKCMNPVRSSGQVTIPDALARLSVQYESLCNESAREERINRAKITSLHQMYANLLQEKDKEHQSIIESLVREINELKGLNSEGLPKKSDSLDPTNRNAEEDIDQIIERMEQNKEQT